MLKLQIRERSENQEWSEMPLASDADREGESKRRIREQHGTMLYFFVIWDVKYDQHRNANMKNKDHLVGQLTNQRVDKYIQDDAHSSDFLANTIEYVWDM